LTARSIRSAIERGGEIVGNVEDKLPDIQRFNGVPKGPRVTGQYPGG
jgi:hypothetical protein